MCTSVSYQICLRGKLLSTILGCAIEEIGCPMSSYMTFVAGNADYLFQALGTSVFAAAGIVVKTSVPRQSSFGGLLVITKVTIQLSL